MLVGEFKTKLTDKNRLALPKKFRDELGKEIVVTRGFEGCVTVVNPAQFKNLIETFEDKPFTQSGVRDTRRFFIGGAVEIETDTQGRFVVPEHLKTYADVSGEVVFVGLVDWVEVWSAENWSSKLNELKQQAPTIAETLTDVYTKS